MIFLNNVRNVANAPQKTTLFFAKNI